MSSRTPLFAPPRKQRARPLAAVVFDPLERDPGYLLKKMFGCDAAYLDGRLCLVAADRDAPWDGLLVGTSQAHHASLTGDIPNLQPHAVLGKWLYIPQQDESFEAVAQQLVSLTLARDPRIGVAPSPRPSRRTRPG